jgi:outer membrane protein assembly factor BamB
LGKDETIYFGTNKQFFAYYLNGSLKWIFDKEKKFSGTTTMDFDGTIYVGTDDGHLYAIYPNGTIKWEYYVGKYDYIYDPAVDDQGYIYFTTVDTNSLFCLNPNGTLKWKYTVDSDFSYGPVIGDDGTIYIVPIHNLMAINPDGTEKWDIYMDNWAGHPSLAPDGSIIVAGAGGDYVTAVDPSNGYILWQYLISKSVNYIDKSEVAIGGDGTIYFAYSFYDKVGYLCALTSDGILKWETHLTSDIQPYRNCYIFSEPCICSDGTVYITTCFSRGGNYSSFGYLHAIGMQNPIEAPESPIITGETNGKIGNNYEYTLWATSPTGDDVYYFVEWGDYMFEKWFGPFPSEAQIKVNHTWMEKGTFNIRVRAKTGDGLCGPWSELKVTIPRSRTFSNSLFLRFLENHPHAFPLIRLFLQS